jgi:hypothetical protein
MEAPDTSSSIQEDCKGNNTSEDADRNDIHCTRKSYNLVLDTHNEISPLQRMSSRPFSAAQNTGLENIREDANEDDCAHSTYISPPFTTFAILPSHTTPSIKTK